MHPTTNYKSFEIPAGKKPYVILVVGVNGVGKTTTIGKLAYNYKKAGKSVLLALQILFVQQQLISLTIWSERVGVPIVKQPMGSILQLLHLMRCKVLLQKMRMW